MINLPDLWWASSGIDHKGTLGCSQNAGSAFTYNMLHGARYLAKLQFADRLTDRVDEMQDPVNARASDEGYDQIKYQPAIPPVTQLTKVHVLCEVVTVHEAVLVTSRWTVALSDSLARFTTPR